MYKETVGRSVVKTIVWRIVVFVVDFSIVFLFTQNVSLSTKLALVKVVVSFILYYGHERAWNRIGWGKS